MIYNERKDILICISSDKIILSVSFDLIKLWIFEIRKVYPTKTMVAGLCIDMYDVRTRICEVCALLQKCDAKSL